MRNRIMTLSATAIAVGLLTASPALAYRTMKPADCAPGRGFDPATPVQVRIHAPSANSLLAPGDIPAMEADVQYVIDQVNGVVGSSLELSFGSDVNSPPVFDVEAFDLNHVIQIGFVAPGDAPEDKADNPAWAPSDDIIECETTQSNVAVNMDFDWVFGTPEDNGSLTPWKEGKSISGSYLFRIILLHEMGHAIGLHHPETEYAIMDHGTKPWTSGADGSQAEYLPDDRAGLRAVYPDPGWDEVDITVTGTWFGHPNPDDDAAQQVNNCLPTRLGSSWVDVDDSGWCAPDLVEPNVVCPGDFVQVRYAVNNNSGLTTDIEEHLWFSTDAEWGFSDWLSPTTREFTMSPEDSRILGRTFQVPWEITPGAYWPISQINHEYLGVDADQFNNFVPMNGKIIVEDFPECGWHITRVPIDRPRPWRIRTLTPEEFDPPTIIDPIDP